MSPLFYEPEREEAWLEDVSSYGYHLVKPGSYWRRFLFEECAPGEYIHRVVMLKNKPESSESKQYIEFVEETGAEYVGSRRNLAYFKKPAAMGDFVLFSDIDSQVDHLNRSIRMNRHVLALFSILFFICIIPTVFFLSDRFIMWQCSFFLLLVTVFLLYGNIKLSSRKRKMEVERTLHE